MKINFKKCIENKKIFKADEAKFLVDKEMKLAAQDLEEALERLEAKKYRWPTIQCYYSMFHSARALLYSKGYRERSHICLVEAIRELFVKDGTLPKEIVEIFSKSKLLREDADYKGDFTEDNAKVLADFAKIFLDNVKEILNRKLRS